MSDVLVPVSPPDDPRGTALRPADRETGTGRAGRPGSLVPALLALAAVGGLLVFGGRVGWKMPKFSALTGAAVAAKDDWCEEHAVPDSVCVECKKEASARGCAVKPVKATWCDTHGVPECPFCDPGLAQLVSPPAVTPDQLAVAAAARGLTDRVENSSKCKLHQRLIQFASLEAYGNAAIRVEPVATGSVVEAVSAPGEIAYDPTRVARLASRLPGTVWRVEKRAGDRVRRGDVLALVDAAEVGRAKSAFLQALLQAELKGKNLAGLRAASDSVPSQSVRLAGAAVEEAEIQLVASRQALLNLGLPVRTEPLRGLEPAEAARRVQFIGLPASLAPELDGKTASANLWPLLSPQEGVVVSRRVMPGETVEAGKVLFVVADTSRVWLALDVRLEDARRVKKGQPVRFRVDGKGPPLAGIVDWVSTAVAEKTRTVKARAELDNAGGGLRAATFGTAEVVEREEGRALVVPGEAVHWEGCCYVVFVRDKEFDAKDAPRLFHVRKVQPGARTGDRTEIIAGVLPGELVATTGSGLLRSELLKNNLGAG